MGEDERALLSWTHALRKRGKTVFEGYVFLYMVRWCINKNWVSSWSTGSALTSLTVHSPHRPPHFWVPREQAVLVFHALILFPLPAWIIHLNATEGNQATMATVKQQRLRKESRPLLCIDFPIEWIASMLFWSRCYHYAVPCSVRFSNRKSSSKVEWRPQDTWVHDLLSPPQWEKIANLLLSF